MSDIIQNIKKTVGLNSPCGNEKQMQDYIKQRLKRIGSVPYADGMGNIILKAEKASTSANVRIFAHMDEPCFIVTQVCKNGYLKFETLGGIRSCSILSKRVTDGKTKGVISAKAIHLLSKEEREKPIQPSDLFIDIGAKSEKEALSAVMPGDYFVFDSDFIELGNNLISCHGIGDKISCFALLDIAEYFKCSQSGVLDYVFTVQKNVYNRGIRCVLNSLDSTNPVDFGIAIDCIDLQEIDKDVNDIHSDVIYVSVDKALFGRISKVIERIDSISAKLNTKIEYLINSEKTDSDAFKKQNLNIAAAAFMIGCLNKNTGHPIINAESIKKLEELIINLTEDIAQNGI